MYQRQSIHGFINETSRSQRMLPAGGFVNEVAVAPPATSYAVTGPSSGIATVASDVFTSRANGSTTAQVTVSDGQGFTTTFAAHLGEFSYTAASAGLKTLTFSNNSGLPNPAPLSFNAVNYVSPPTLVVDSQSPPDGQSLTIEVTTTNAHTVNVALTNAANEVVGPFNFDVVANKATARIFAIPAQSYTVLITALGLNGDVQVAGAPFTINGVTGTATQETVEVEPDGTTVRITLVDESEVPLANQLGLRWAWFDQSTPDQFSQPTDRGADGATDGFGVLSLAIGNSVLVSGETGWLIVTNSDGALGVQHMAFSGPVAVV
jgi:hypothetical protein